MPIYEYECSSCGAHSEQMQKMQDAPLLECPKCGKPALKRLISAPAFQLKGEGWYVTDFRGKKEGAVTGTAASHSHPTSSEGTAEKTESVETSKKNETPSSSSENH